MMVNSRLKRSKSIRYNSQQSNTNERVRESMNRRDSVRILMNHGMSQAKGAKTSRRAGKKLVEVRKSIGDALDVAQGF